MINEKIKNGYWSIAAQKHIKNFKADVAHKDDVDSLNTAGKAGRLLGAIRGSSRIENVEKLEKMASNVGIGRNELHRIILPELENSSDGQIEITRNIIGEITGVSEYIFDNNAVLNISGQVFENLNPKELERITIDTLDITKKRPYLESELINELLSNGYKEKNINVSLIIQEYFRLLQKLSKGVKELVYSNEYVWGPNHEKIAYAVSQLELDKRQTLGDVIQVIQNKQGISEEKLPKIDNNLFLLAKKIGMINPTTIITRRNVNKDFDFSSHLIDNSLYDDDILDDVKLFIASIRFGENYTLHSKLRNTSDFINALIERDKVGPHTANGTDYTLLEERGIIKVEKSYEDRYYMSLLRKDVGREALKIISNPQFSIDYDIDPQHANSILERGTFLSPEENRLRLGDEPKNVKEAMDYMVRVLRDELI